MSKVIGYWLDVIKLFVGIIFIKFDIFKFEYEKNSLYEVSRYIIYKL